MPRPKTVGPTDGELEILQVIWRLNVATVRDILEEIEKQRPLAFSTVATMITIMEKKGMIVTTNKLRPFKYKAVQDADTMGVQMVTSLKNKLFGGSVRKMVLSLFRAEQIDAKQLAKLEKIVAEME